MKTLRWGGAIALGLGALGLLGAVAISSSSLGPPPALTLPAGMVPGYSTVNKFGRAPDVDTGPADVWDRSATQKLWVAPTAARVHNLVSTSANDDGSPAGTGARTLRVFGLQTWSNAETSEDLTLNGVSNVATVNSYVIIHRMRVLTGGSAGPNVGVISATAVDDATVTAQIAAGEGQTQMAIYGVPSGSTLYFADYFVGANAATPAGAKVQFSLLVNQEPDVQAATFLNQSPLTVEDSMQPLERDYPIWRKFDGPALIKIQAVSDTNNADVTAEFDAVIFRP